MSDALDDLADDAAEQAAEVSAQSAAQIMREFRANFGDEAAAQMLRIFHGGYQPTETQARGIRANVRAAGVPHLTGGRYH